MKTLNAIRYTLVFGLALLLFHGCVYSVHPLFGEKDLVMREDLLGRWTAENNTVWEFSRNGKYYEALHIERGDTTYLEGRLGLLGDQYFLNFNLGDFDKLHGMEMIHLFPTHTFARVTFNGDQVTFNWFASEWLENLIKEKRIRIKHELEGGEVLLTAPTAELQKFVGKYLDEPRAFDESHELKREVAP